MRGLFKPWQCYKDIKMFIFMGIYNILIDSCKRMYTVRSNLKYNKFICMTLHENIPEDLE